MSKSQFSIHCGFRQWIENWDLVGLNPHVRVVCNIPYHGTCDDLVRDVCQYLDSISNKYEVLYLYTKDSSTKSGDIVYSLVMQVALRLR